MRLCRFFLLSSSFFFNYTETNIMYKKNIIIKIKALSSAPTTTSPMSQIVL